MLPLKPAIEDLAERAPAWVALSEMFLDTDTAVGRPWRAKQLAASPYSIAQLETILVDEVYPVCKYNLRSVAGEWAGFNADWLSAQILQYLCSPWRMLRFIDPGRRAVCRSDEWRATVATILTLRSQGNEDVARLGGDVV